MYGEVKHGCAIGVGRTEVHLLVGSLEAPWQLRLTVRGLGHQAATGIRMWSGHWTTEDAAEDGMTG